MFLPIEREPIWRNAVRRATESYVLSLVAGHGARARRANRTDSPRRACYLAWRLPETGVTAQGVLLQRMPDETREEPRAPWVSEC